MYNIKSEGKLTGKKLKEIVKNINDDAEICVEGDNYFYIHEEEDGSVINFDNNSLEDEQVSNKGGVINVAVAEGICVKDLVSYLIENFNADDHISMNGKIGINIYKKGDVVFISDSKENAFDPYSVDTEFTGEDSPYYIIATPMNEKVNPQVVANYNQYINERYNNRFKNNKYIMKKKED